MNEIALFGHVHKRAKRWTALFFFLDDGRQASVHRCGVIANEKR